MYSLLIADDEALEREVLSLFARGADLGFQTIGETENGKDTLLKILVDKPDVVILDIKMPGMSGLEVLEQARNAGSTAKVIISTAYDQFDFAVKALQLGASDFLVKPVKKETLVGSLTQVVSRLDEERRQREQKESFEEVMRLLKANAEKDRSEEERDFPQAVLVVKRYIEEHFDQHIGLDEIISDCGYSKYHISRLFKSLMGMTIMEYLVQRRMEEAKRKLAQTELSVKEIAIEIGYSDPNYFSWAFAKEVGIPPLQYRMQQGKTLAKT